MTALIAAIGVAVYAQFAVHRTSSDPLAWLLLGLAALFAAGFAGAGAPVDAINDTGSRAVAFGRMGRAVCAALAVGAIAAVIILSTWNVHPVIALLLWLASGAIGGVAVRGWRVTPARLPLRAWTSRQRAVLAAILALGAAARVLWIDSLPRAYFGDEQRVAMYLAQAYGGRVVPNFFRMGWNTWPVIGLSLQGLFAPLFGMHITTLRLSSALMGTLAVLTTALAARELVGNRAALFAAALFAVCRTAIDFSRLGIAHAQILFLEPLALFLLWRALNGGWAVHYLWAGIATAWCLYSYNAGQLVPLLVFGWLALGAVLRPRAIGTHWRGATLLGIGFALTLLPYLYYFTDAFQFGPNWDQWTIMARNRQTMGRVLDAWHSAGAAPAWEILRTQIWTTWLGFGVLPGGGYGLGYRRGGMLDDVSAALFLLGLAMALRRVRQANVAFLPYWWLVTVIAGGIATIDPPSFVRMVGLLPVLAILAALPLEWLTRPGSSRSERAVGAIVAAALVIGASWQNWQTYFVEFAAQPADPISELARYVGELDPSERVIVLGSEHHIAVHNELFMIEFPERTLDIPDPAHVLPLHEPVTTPLTLVLASTQETLIPYIRSLYPTARVSDGADGRQWPFRAVHVTPEIAAQRAGLNLSVQHGDTADAAAERRDEAAGVVDPFGPLPASAGGASRLVWTGSVYWPSERPLQVTLNAGQPTTVAIGAAAPLQTDGHQPLSAMLTLPRGWQPLRIEEQVEGPHRLAITVTHPGPPRGLTRWDLRPESTPQGLLATYTRADGSSMQVLDPQLNAFAVEDRYPPEQTPFIHMPFTVSWRGALRVDAPGRYAFEAVGSGPFTVSLDGAKLFASDVPVPEQPAVAQAQRQLAAGLHPIVVNWDSSRPAHTTRRLFQLFWTPPNGQQQLIPPDHFVPPDAAADAG